MHTDAKGNTKKHVQRTRIATMVLARALGLDDRTNEALEFASTLHDVGKISIPTYILQKPTRLTELEFQKMSTHPEVGAQILSSINFPGPVIEIVRHHHENWDGSGYPDGLSAEEIPVGARIICATEVYDALTTARPYQKKLSPEEAVDRMGHLVGTVIDPQVLEGMSAAVESRKTLVFIDAQESEE